MLLQASLPEIRRIDAEPGPKGAGKGRARGKSAPRRNLEMVLGTILTVQDFAVAHGDSLLELGINPLMVRPAGKGVVAVVVLIRLTEG